MRAVSRVGLCLSALALLLVLASSPPGARGSRPEREWRVYGGDLGATRYSPLDQIHRSNVQRLKVAWVFHTGDKRDNPPTTIECNPIVVDGTLYLTSPSLKVFALNAATGQKRWEFDPGQTGQRVSRGVTYWESGTDRRIFVTAGGHLYALDAGTGRPIPTFGESGRVDLRSGLDRDVAGLHVAATTPGVVFRDRIIVGSHVGEGPDATAPGHVRAFDVRTGRRVWIFHTIPHPGEFGHDTWHADSWKTAGAANCWGGMSLDERRGVVYLATGSPSYDFYGGDRPGQNLFGNCVVALNAETGKRLWHFQTVHHDLWDYDLPCPPVLVTVQQNGRRVDGVAQVTKTGFVFLLDRETGKPLFPVEERPVPASDLEGEAASPTQPVPVKPPPFVRQIFTEREVTDLTPEAHEFVLRRFRETRGRRLYAPPSREGTIVFPGFHGGANWSGASFDPTTGRLYVNANEIPWILTMRPADLPSGMAGSQPARAARTGGAARRGSAGRLPSLRHRSEGLGDGGPRSGDREGTHALWRRRRQRGKGRGLRRLPAPLRLHRLPPVPGPRWLPGDQAALGHADLDRSEPGRDRLADPARRSAGAEGAQDSADGHGKLRRLDRHRGRTALYRRDEGPQVPRLRQGDGQGPLGDAARRGRQRHSQHL